MTQRDHWMFDHERIVLFDDIVISSAELLALNATPKEIIAAPGVGLALIGLGAYLKLDFESVAYDGIAAGEDLSFKYTDASGDEILQVEATGFLDAVADAHRYAQPNTNLITPVENAPIVLHMLVGEIASGNSPLKIRQFYRVVPFTL